MNLREHDTPAFRTVAATGIGYGLVLLGIFFVLFVLPYLLFALL